MKTRAWWAAAGSIAAAAMVWALWQPERAPAATGSSAATAAAPVPSAGEGTAPAGGCALAVGDRGTFKLGVTNTLELEPALAAAAGRSALTTTVSGQLTLEVVQVGPLGAVALAQLSAVQAPAQLHPEALAQPFLIELDRQCGLTRFARHAQTPRPDARTQQGLVAELTWRWTAGLAPMHGENAKGAWSGTMTTAEDAEGVVARRRLETYTRVWEGQPGVVASGLATVRPGQGFWFERLAATETAQTRGVVSRLEVEAVRSASPSALAPTVDRDLTHYGWEDLLPQQFPADRPAELSPEDERLREGVRNLTVTQALDALHTRTAKGGNIAAAWPPMRAWLESHPGQTMAVAAALQRGQVHEEAVNPLYIALGNARTPEARDTLLFIKRDSTAPPTERARAMFALLDRRDVGVPLAEEFRKDARVLKSEPKSAERFVASEALLAVTAFAGLQQDDGIRQVAEASVRELLDANASIATQRSSLHALGNLGDARLLALARPFTLSPHEQVRQAATHAVRRLAPADSKDLVLEWLAREPSLLVKRDLFEQLQRQHFDARAKVDPALARVVMAELAGGRHAVIARKAMIRLLGQAENSTDPSVREALKAQARLEFKRGSNLFSEVLAQLTPEEVREVAP